MNVTTPRLTTAQRGRPGESNPPANGSFGLNRMWRSRQAPLTAPMT